VISRAGRPARRPDLKKPTALRGVVGVWNCESSGRGAGLSAAEIDAAATDGPVSGINPEYILVCKATDELSNGGTLRDETLRELLDKYGEAISRKIVLMIGWFNMLSLFLNGCRVPLETTDKVGTRTSPLRAA